MENGTITTTGTGTSFGSTLFLDLNSGILNDTTFTSGTTLYDLASAIANVNGFSGANQTNLTEHNFSLSRDVHPYNCDAGALMSNGGCPQGNFTDRQTWGVVFGSNTFAYAGGGTVPNSGVDPIFYLIPLSDSGWSYNGDPLGRIFPGLDVSNILIKDGVPSDLIQANMGTAAPEPATIGTTLLILSCMMWLYRKRPYPIRAQLPARSGKTYGKK